MRLLFALKHAVIVVYPEAVIRDGCGVNPLFAAIGYKSKEEVVRCLVEAYPDSTRTRDRANGFPLRRAVENQSSAAVQKLLCTSREVVVDADSCFRRTVLHEFMSYGCLSYPYELVISRMLHLAPELATLPSTIGKSPLHLAIERLMTVKSNYERRKRVRNIQGWREHSSDLGSEEARYRHITHVVNDLMRAAYYGEEVRRLGDEHVNHAVVGLFGIPHPVVAQILQSNRLECGRKDCWGDYPLFLAIMGGGSACELSQRNSATSPVSWTATTVSATSCSFEQYLKEKELVVLDLLCAFPEAARSTDRLGRSPLALAASSANAISPRIVTELMTENPAAVRCFDGQVGLLPFQIAALPKQPSFLHLPVQLSIDEQEEWRAHEDSAIVTSIYLLLREAPEVIYLCTELFIQYNR